MEGVVDWSTGRISKHLPNHTAQYAFLYRCGWCGHICDSDGTPTEIFERELHDVDAYEVVLLNGLCCPNGDMYK